MARYKGVPAELGLRQVISLKLDTTKYDFEKDRERVSVKQGSVILTVSLPADGAGRLLHSREAQDKLRTLLGPIKLLSISEIGEDPTSLGEKSRRFSGFRRFLAFMARSCISHWCGVRPVDCRKARMKCRAQ